MNNSRSSQLKYGLTVCLFLLPAILGLVLFQYVPMIVALRNSFYNYNLLIPDRASFIGLSNYAEMIKDSTFFVSLLNTLLYSMGKVIVQIPLSLAFAIIVHQKIKGIGFVRSAIFAPVVTSGAVVAVIWNLMYSPANGLFDSILSTVGLPSQPFLTSAKQALASITVMGIWQDLGFSMLIILAGLQGIPDEFLEAASIDGAGAWDRIRYITIPLLKRTILYAVVVTTIFSFTIFTPVYIMTQGGPSNSTLVAVFYIYQQGFLYLKMGYASALAVMLTVIMVGIALLEARLLRSGYEYS